MFQVSGGFPLLLCAIRHRSACDRTPALTPSSHLDRREHIPVEEIFRQPRLPGIGVKARSDDDHDVESRHDEDALSAKSDPSYPHDLAPIDHRPAKPPVIAKKIHPIGRGDMWRDGDVYPFRGHDLLSSPLPAIEHQLAELCRVARSQTQ